MFLTTKGLKAMSKPWSSQELETLEEMWGNFAVPTISKHLGRSPNAIITKARKIGLGENNNSTKY